MKRKKTMAILAVLVIVSVTGFVCRDPVAARYHFSDIKNFLTENNPSECDSKTLTKKMTFFVRGAGSTQEFLRKRSQSTDPQTAITAYVIIATVGRCVDNLLKETSEPVKCTILQQVIQRIDFEGQLSRSRAMEVDSIPDHWKEWFDAAQTAMQQTLARGAKGSARKRRSKPAWSRE